MPTQIKNLKQLKNLTTKGNEFFITLNFGLRSYKHITLLKNGKFYVENSVDDSKQLLTEKELKNKSITNIYHAIKKGAFFMVS